MADLVSQIAKWIARPHALPDSERPSRLRTAITVIAPFVVLAVIVTLLALNV